MTYDSAIRSLSDGKAAKLSSWGGYIYRTDTTDGIEEFSTSTAKVYHMGDLVQYLYVTYVCKVASCTGGTWDPENWEKTVKYTLTFRKRTNKDGVPQDITYTYIPTYAGGAVVYHVEPDGLPSSSEFEDMMPLDGSLLLGFQSSEWIVGSMVEFEKARTGASNIW